MIRRIGLVSALVGLGLAASVSSATAAETIGQLAPANPSALCIEGPRDAIQTALAAGTSYTVPTDGTITQWNTSAAAGAGQTLKMKVFRPVSGTTYTVVAHDGPRPLTPSVINTFTVSIPVKAGDLIGLNDQNASTVPNACLFATGQSGDVFSASEIGDAADGSPETLSPITGGFRLNLTAVLVPPAVSPPAGATGQRAAALKKCKKKHKKAVEKKKPHDALTQSVKKKLNKQFKRCKKQANLLPV